MLSTTAPKFIHQIMAIAQKEERFSGPVAHPKHLKQYEEILPGSAERMLKMAENSLFHNQAIQKIAVDAEVIERRLTIDADIKYRHLGIWLGFSALLSMFACAFLSMYLGHAWVAGAFLGVGATGIVTAFVKGRKDDD